MNDVYSNPEYMNELDEYLLELSPLLHEDPKKAYLIIRNAIINLTASEDYKERIKCGSITNCSFCCHDEIKMGKVEAEYIKAVIIKREIIPNKNRIELQNSESPLKWMNKACPMLLDENEKGQRLCSIYDERPLICITHNNVEDPQKCNKEDDPTKHFTEVKAAIVDALGFTSFRLGNKNNIEAEDSMVSLHKMLAEMVF